MDNRAIGLTGGIGAGKSVVARILRCNGCFVYDCDSRAKYLMNFDLDLKSSLISNLGDGIFDADGFLDRKYLSKIIFENNNVRLLVNSLVHSAVRRDIEKIMSECKKEIFFIESAIPVTGGLLPFCNKIWIVEAPIELRIKRTMKRDLIDEFSILSRIRTQENEISGIPDAMKIIIYNDLHSPLLLNVLKLINNKKYA